MSHNKIPPVNKQKKEVSEMSKRIRKSKYTNALLRKVNSIYKKHDIYGVMEKTGLTKNQANAAITLGKQLGIVKKKVVYNLNSDRLTIRIPKHVKDFLGFQSERTGKSMANIILELIEKHLKSDTNK